MTWVFSKRCQEVLRQGKIKVSIPVTARARIFKALKDTNETWSEKTDTNFIYETSTLKELPGWIEAELGIQQLIAFPEDGGKDVVPSDVEGFILRGNYPPNVLDTIELFYDHLNYNGEHFQKVINDIMKEGNLPWRMFSGEILPIHPIYIEEEIIRKASELLGEVGFTGGMSEFSKARKDLTNGDYEGAIQNANLALESVCKEIVGIERIKPGELYHTLVNSDLVPEYYDGFLKAFEAYILRAPAIMRNEELGVGHGRGASTINIPHELAELGVHLSAVMINYLVKRHLAKNKNVVNPEDIPFS